MRKTSIAIVSIFLCVLTVLSVCAEMIGTDKKYSYNNSAYMTTENLARSSATKNKMTDGNIHTTYNFLGNNNEIVIDLGSEKPFNSIILKEKGLNVQNFLISVSNDGDNYRKIYESDKIEWHRLCTFDRVSARYVKLSVLKSDLAPQIREIEIYNEPKKSNENFRVATYSTLGNTIYGIIDDNNLTEKEKDQKIIELIDEGYYDTVTDYILIGNVRWNENGEVFVSDWNNEEKDIDKYFGRMMKLLHQVLDKKNVNIVLTILNPSGEGGNDKVMTSITENKDKLINNMIAFANKYEIDGIDIDWEFPISQSEFDAYNAFLQALKKNMKEKMWNTENSTLSLALATWALKYTPETIECIDYVNVMGYDIQDQDGQHSSFFSSCVQAAAYIESQGFKKNQINIGFPFYGTWQGGKMEQYLYNSISYEDITPFNNFYTMKKYDTKEDRYTYFNSQSVIRDKTAYSYLNGYGGVMIFSQYCDLPSNDEKSLTKAISDYLQEK